MSVHQKNFDTWNAAKKTIHSREREVYFREREIWWIKLGINIGYEQDGKHLFERPVIIFRKLNKQMFYGIPTTSQDKSGNYYFSVSVHDFQTKAILSQLRVFSKQRLVSKIGTIEPAEFQKLLIEAKKILLPRGG